MINQRSIGASVYHDQERDLNCELDFGIGTSITQHRKELDVKSNQVIVHCTSQDLPFSSELYLISSEAWHDFRTVLNQYDKKYVASWIIDNRWVKTLIDDIDVDIQFAIQQPSELKIHGRSATE